MAGVILGLGLAFATARAEPGAPPRRVAAAEPPGMTEPTVVSDQVPKPESGQLARVAATDAAYDRGYFASTALALGGGQFDMSLRSALKTGAVVAVAAGIGHGIELSIDGAKMGGVGKVLGAGMKLTLARGDRWAVAATASVHNLYEENSDQTTRMYAASVRMTSCVGSACGAEFTLGGGVATSSTAYSDFTQNLTPTLDASFLIGTSWCRPLVEVTMLDGQLGYLGLRFGRRYVAFDVGVGVLTGSTSQFIHDDILAMVGLSVRP